MQCILVKSDQFENSFLLLYIFLKSCLCCCSLATLAAQQLMHFQHFYRFLPECIAYNQSALPHFLPECKQPRRIRGCHDGCHDGCHTGEPLSFFAWILVVMFCSGLHVKRPVKRREEDRGWFSQLLLKTSGRCIELSISLLSSLSYLVE